MVHCTSGIPEQQDRDLPQLNNYSILHKELFRNEPSVNDFSIPEQFMGNDSGTDPVYLMKKEFNHGKLLARNTRTGEGDFHCI